MRRMWFMLLAAVVAGTLLGGMGRVPSGEEVPRMSPEELQARLGAPELVVIDVRREKDWEASDRKIAGAVREDPAAARKWAGNHAKEKTIVLYCA